MKRFAGLLALIAFALPAGARAEKVNVDAAFLTRLATAANARDVAALSSLAASGSKVDFGWVDAGPSMLTKPLPWQAQILNPPGEDNTFVAFTKYHPCESESDHLYPVVSTPTGPRLGSEAAEDNLGGYRVRGHKLSVRFDIPGRNVDLTDSVTIEKASTAAAGPVLRINAIYSVDSIKHNGVSIRFKQAGGFLALDPQTDSRSVYDLKYHGRLDSSGEDYAMPDQAALTSYWYPHIGRMPATSDVTIDVPLGWTAIGQGESLGKSISGKRSIFHWKNNLPVCYFTLAAGKFKVTTRRIGGIDYSAYLIHNEAGKANRAIEVASGAIGWFAKNFSKFPYSRYAVVESDSFPAALECYSFTLCGRNMIPMAVVHEAAHTWWGGVVPNTYTRTLWNESFAEYSDGLYGRMTGKEGMHEFNSRMMAMMAPMMEDSTLLRAHNAMNVSQSLVGYGKGSMVLENLERMLGSQKMLACMRRFIERHKPGEDAEWSDFVSAVTEVAGKEWAGFFPSWLERSDLPDPRLADIRAENRAGKWAVSGRVIQNGPPFWMKLPVVVTGSSGAITSELMVRTDSTPFRIELASKPLTVAIDPNRDTLRKQQASNPAPMLLSLQASNKPLLVVYGTGGSDADSNRFVAQSYMKTAFPFAQITVRADTDVAAPELAAGNVLFIGRPDGLRIPANWLSLLPLRFGDGEIADGETRMRGNELWALAIVAHPTQPKGIVGFAAGLGKDSIRGFRNQGDLPVSQNRMIVSAAGKPLHSRSTMAEDPTLVKLKP